jgi:hypothetical protein
MGKKAESGFPPSSPEEALLIGEGGKQETNKRTEKKKQNQKGAGLAQ